MIRELGNGASPSPAPARDSRSLARLRRLPQPLHLFEFALASQHYHFGCFEGEGESLCRAQDRLAERGAARLAGASNVLDVGCGLGGTSRVLAAHGLAVTALDPCAESIAYARAAARGAGTIRFVAEPLETFARASTACFDGAIAIEVLQHFPVLARFLECCRARLHPGGRIVLDDVACTVDVDWTRVPYHRHGSVPAAARAAGFVVEEHADLTQAILPTLPRLAALLEESRSELRAAFGAGDGSRPVDAELSQLLGHMRGLQDALESGCLRYETTTLRLAAANGASRVRT